MNTDDTTTREEWEEKFDKELLKPIKYEDIRLWKITESQTEQINRIKEFIKVNLLSREQWARADERGKIKGIYEQWMSEPGSIDEVTVDLLIKRLTIK